MAFITGGSALGAGLLAGGNLLGSALNGANSESFGNSSNSSSYGYSGSSYNSSSNWSQVYGSEASAEDILRAAEANELQDRFLLAQMQYNSKEAAVQRAWQEYMSNTSYQRAVEDLYRAGLNPILAATNYGASTPTGAVASTGLQTAYKAQTFPNQSSGGSSEGYSSESGGGSSQGESHNESRSEQQATSIAKGAVGIAKTVMNSLVKGVQNAFSGGSGKSAYDKYDQPLNY